MLVVPTEDMQGKLIRGICGQVPGSVIPGMMGLEAGQSAFGDAYAWFRELISWPMKLRSDIKITGDQVMSALAEEAAALPLNDLDALAVDWLNGRRTPDASQDLKGAIINLDLATNAPEVFKALVEATCFGARAIVDRFEEQGIPVKGLIGLGGVARKSPYIMQVLADVMNMPIRIHRSEQTCAAGAAMFAATAAGLFPNVSDAMVAMGQGFDKEYRPDAARTGYYSRRYDEYRKLGAFIESSTNTHRA
jgi:L-ribulokinase